MKAAKTSMIIGAALMVWSGAAAAELSCKDLRRGHMFADPDILRTMAEIATPLIRAENGGSMPDDRAGAFAEMAFRLQAYCDTLSDANVDAIIASILKSAPERYAEREAEKVTEKAAAEEAAAEKAAAEEGAAITGSRALPARKWVPTGAAS